MTSDDLPPARLLPELRASDEDRERAIEVLRVAAGDGRITAPELEQRVETALTARTVGNLAELTADLIIGVEAAKARDVVQINCEGANVSRRGRWRVPYRMEIRAVGGKVTLDLTEAIIASSTLRIEAEVVGGRLVLVTRPGIEVDADAVAVRGGKVRVRPEHESMLPVVLRVEITGKVHGGNLVARSRRRTFAQWALRRSVQYPRLGA
jgi:hypothetical protein